MRPYLEMNHSLFGRQSLSPTFGPSKRQGSHLAARLGVIGTVLSVDRLPPTLANAGT